MPRVVTHQPKDGNPPEGSVLQKWNLELKLHSPNLHKVTTAMDDGLYILGLSPTKEGHLPYTTDMEFGT